MLFEEDLSNVVPKSFVKFYLFYTFVYPENFMRLAEAIITCLNFGILVWGGPPIMVPPNFGIWYIFYCTYIYLFWKFYQSKLSGLKVWILAAPLEEHSLIFYSQILSNFIFCLCLPTQKISCVELKRLKNLNLGCLVWKGPPHSGILKFCQNLYFPYTYLP